MLSFEAPLVRVRKGLGVSFVGPEAEDQPVVPARPNASIRSLALGHRLRRAMDVGEASGFADLAERMGCSEGWVSALVGLTFLAPDIQAAVLAGGADACRLSLEELKVLGRMRSWVDQRRRWSDRAPVPVRQRVGSPDPEAM